MIENNNRFKMVASAYLILIKSGKVLLSRRYQTGWQDGSYGLPAGHVEDQETVSMALAREASEEIGIKIDLKNIKYLHTMHRECGGYERIDIFFSAKKWEGEIINNEPEKCDDLSWFPLRKLPNNTIPYIRSAIMSCVKGVNYSEFGWKK